LIDDRDKSPAPDRRDQFLVAMYNATWSNISRHLLVVWQSVAALFTAVAAAFLSDKQLLSPDYAFSIVILASSWSAAHAIDAKGWFNRNLLIVTNIERQFLRRSDADEIHPFFVREHHAGFVDHLAIQFILACSIWLLALTFHFLTRVLGGIGRPSGTFEPTRALPYLCAGVAVIVVAAFNSKVNKRHRCLMGMSPGLLVTDAATDKPNK